MLFSICAHIIVVAFLFVQVKISDNGTPELYSITIVEVEITDENDNSPQFFSDTIALHLPQEGLPLEKAFYKATAFDPDSGNNGRIIYSLRNVSSQLKNIIYVDSEYGWIYARKTLLRLSTNFFAIASNGKLISESKIHLNVIECAEKKDFVIKNSGHTFRVSEDTDVKEEVIKISIEPSNVECVRYFLDSSNEDNNDFVITDSEAPIVQLSTKLDYEKKKVYNVTVLVTDAHKKVVAWFKVEVENVNDEYPIIESYKVHEVFASEYAKIDEELYELSASDPDGDQLDFIIKFASTTSSLSTFGIDSRTGVLRLKKRLDHEVQTEHELVISVSDGKHEVLSRILIKVKNENDHKPKFIGSKYSINISPSTSFGSKVLQVTARDPDKGEAGQVRYSIVGGNTGNCWRIDESDGSIFANTNLANIKRKTFHLSVQASDKKHFDRANVAISLSSSEYELPKFSQRNFYADIEENREADYPIITLQLLNRVSVSYEILAGNALGRFVIDPTTGTILTTEPLDYEAERLHNLTIRVMNLALKGVNVFVTVRVIDVNDNRPVWSQLLWKGRVRENSRVGTAIIAEDGSLLTLKAFDKDSGLNGQVEYSLIESHVKQNFTINEVTGAVLVNGLIDREKQSRFTFTARVNDKSPTRKLLAHEDATIIIDIEDVEDTHPQFENNRYETTILLPTYPGVHVITVSATDEDETSKLTFSLKNKVDGFEINPITGEITIVKHLSQPDKVILTPVVSDQIFTDWSTVKVHLKQSKSSTLMFQNYEAKVVEESRQAVELATIFPANHQSDIPLRFRLINYKNLFSVRPYSGMVVTNGLPFDREEQSHYFLAIEAHDLTKSENSALVFVNVTIEDINDHSPLFVRQPYIGFVNYNLGVGRKCFQVSAVDKDIGVNGVIKYDLDFEYSGERDYFSISSKSGKVKLSQKLSENDVGREFRMTVRARDSATKYLQSEATLVMKVINDVSPSFKQTHYVGKISEDAEIGSVVTTVEAESKTGNILSYSIVHGDEFDEFEVDYNIGSIKVKRPLDYDNENYRFYKLIIRVTEIPTKSYHEASLQIFVEDANDNAPVLSLSEYQTSISERTSINSLLLNISATDKDSKQNAKLKYYFVPEENEYLRIDVETGAIYLIESVDRESISRIQATVRVSDSGVPSLYSEADIIIQIEDVNDNSPTIQSDSLKVEIYDDISPKTFVSVIYATDNDISDLGKLRYSFINGNQENLFRIDSKTGIITMADAVSRKQIKNSLYVLNVTVTDGIFTEFAVLNIKVNKRNRYLPIFTKNVYETSLENSEGRDVRILNVSIQANDADDGKMGKVKYTLECEDYCKSFNIRKRTGKLSVLGELDPSISPIELSVKATDGGGRESKCLVRINVIGREDLTPSFIMKEYRANLIVGNLLGTHVVQLRIEQDFPVKYSLLSENKIIHNLFAIDSTGLISLTVDLDSSHATKLFQFFAVVEHSLHSDLKNQVPVEIYVRGITETVPGFDLGICDKTLSIREDSNIGSFVTEIRTINSGNKLSIVPGNSKRTGADQFAINDHGKLTVFKRVDREEVEQYEITIRGETGATPPIVEHCSIFINLLDMNDNSPEFEPLVNEVVVNENENIGTPVSRLSAFDPDYGPNGTIVYTLANFPNEFSIDGTSGQIHTAAVLDYEKVTEYKLAVVASDLGSPPLASTMTVTIKVNNLNDERPKFENDLYKHSIYEDAAIGQEVLILQAVDLDEDGSVSHYILSGNEESKFKLDRSGKLTINKELDRERTSEYTLEILATDSLYTTTATVKIKVNDINDNDPRCEEKQAHAAIHEDVNIDTMVYTIKAHDPDIEKNGQISYSLSGERHYDFSIGAKNGQIVTKAKLDYEVHPYYNLTAKAKDFGGRYCETRLLIEIKNVNDNPPKFERDTYNFQIREGINNGVVGRVWAFDPDLDANQLITYQISDSSNKFAIDREKGIITLLESLDREKKAKYTFQVVANDDVDSHSNYATVNVVVLDVNDNPPIWERELYSIELAEDLPIKSNVLKIQATSLDVGINAQLSYEIIRGNTDGVFTIDRKEGTILLSKELDYEKQKEYSLLIQAVDSGVPPLSSNTQLKIIVTDKNDNAPYFGTNIPIIKHVREEEARGKTILRVSAKDIDSGDNGRIEYSLKECQPEHHFIIDERSGELKAVEVIDREKVTQYDLKVEAKDFGKPRLSSTISVQIVVDDINDNTPTFTKSIYETVVQESSEVGYSIVKVSATDPDGEGHAGPFRYSLLYGGEKKFRVDSKTGWITTTDIFRPHEQFSFKVKAFDQGNLHSTAIVNVKVVKEGRNPPKLYGFNATLRISGETAQPGPVGRLRAYDKDPYDANMLRFSIHSYNKYFKVDIEDGTLHSLKPLDPGEYAVNTSVADTKHVSYSMVYINVKKISRKAVKNSVIVHISDMLPSDFLHAKYKETFMKVVSSIVAPPESNKQLLLLGMEEAHHVILDEEVIEKRKRRSVPTDLLLFLAVKHSDKNSIRPDERYVNNVILRENLLNFKAQIERDSRNLRIVNIKIDECKKAKCEPYKCLTEVEIAPQLNRYITEQESFVSPGLKMVSKCDCPIGFRGPSCKEDARECIKCRAPEECKKIDGEYSCVCPQGFNCQGVKDQDEEQVLSFTGNSYVEWKVAKSIEQEMILSLELRTLATKGPIMHTSGTKLYSSIIEISDGCIQYRWDCGSGRNIIRIQQQPISDGWWHSVIVRRNQDCSAEIIIDNKYKSRGKAGVLRNDVNLEAETIIFGAQLRRGTVKSGFEGCLRHIVMNSQPLHPSIAMFSNVQAGCGISSASLCQSSYCSNGGICKPIPEESNYKCLCPPNTTGRACEKVISDVISAKGEFRIWQVLIACGIIIILILFALSLVCLIKKRKTKARERRELMNGSCTYNKVGEDLDPAKCDHLELTVCHQPPPIPQRPSSYTPSDVGSTLVPNALGVVERANNYSNDAIEERNSKRPRGLQAKGTYPIVDKNNLNISFDDENMKKAQNKELSSSGGQSSFDVQSEGPSKSLTNCYCIFLFCFHKL
ncbi:DgyrCDS3952 [Dimorphilus gyrociliatus]|uniref:DgyrCDS3952 n=1 Tax=Dimorphilus gyrociliatus TaxID=2664684 RepID=A0A7I8VFG2_9ANNE|nr:DgyrCDS3952 [Dimorphilus gyrociliatus]